MNNKLIILLGTLLWGSLLPHSAAEIFVVNSASRTLSRIDSVSDSVDNSFAQLGLTPNLMDLDADRIYVVCSGDNAIQVLSRANGAHIRYLPVAASSNPYDVAKDGEFLYVSGLFTDKVYKISLQSNSVVGSLQVGISPEGLAVGGGRLYVCNTGGYANNYAQSSISVIDLETFSTVATVPVWTNPQYAVLRGGYLHVSCTGNWSNVAGRVDIIDLASLEVAHSLPLGGRPGCLWIGEDDIAYVGDGTGSALYSYDANSFEVLHDSSNPLNYSAFAISGTGGAIAMLEQNWTGSSQVRLYNSQLTLLGQYTVGISSTDLLMAGGSSGVSEEVTEAPRARLWPNPLPRGTSLKLEIGESGPARLDLYNLRGQRVLSVDVSRAGTEIESGHLSPGVYLYRVRSGLQADSGKLLLLP